MTRHGGRTAGAALAAMLLAGELYVLSKANGRVWKVTGTRGSAP